MRSKKEVLGKIRDGWLLKEVVEVLLDIRDELVLIRKSSDLK